MDNPNFKRFSYCVCADEIPLGDTYYFCTSLKSYLKNYTSHEDGSITLDKNNDEYDHNKFIASVYFLQKDKFLELLDKVNNEILVKCILMLTILDTFYSYIYNSEKIIAMTRLMLQKIQGTHTNFAQFILQCHKNVRRSSEWYFYNIRLEMQTNPHNIAPLKCVTDNYGMEELLQEFEVTKNDEDVCKYCLSMTPKEQLVFPCKCKSPIHIRCFLKFFQRGNTCEICLDRFSRVNELRCRSQMTHMELEKLVFFPFDDLYPIPLAPDFSLRKVTGDDKFVYALCYLQCKRMKDLLRQAIEEGIVPDFGEMLEYFADGSLPSNYLARSNICFYADMVTILYDYSRHSESFSKIFDKLFFTNHHTLLEWIHSINKN